MEAFWRYAHNRYRVGVHLYLPADDRRITVKALFPVAVSQHGDRFGSVLLRLRAINQTASRRFEPQSRKVVSTHIAVQDRFYFAVSLHACQVEHVTDNV